MAGISALGVAQIAVTVRDVERAKRFYRDKLGLAHLFDAPPGLSFLRCGETRLMLSQPEGPETVGNSIVYYGVEDAEADSAALAAEGITFEEKAKRIAVVEGREVWLAICRDTEGNLLGLMSERAAA